MKSVKLLALAVFALCTGIQAYAQTADEVVNKHIEAMGGKDKLSALKTVKMTGSMSVQGTDVAITMTKSQLTGMRMEMEIMGTSNYQVANAKQGWVFMPVMGMTEPKEMDPDQYKSFSVQNDIQGSLLNYKEKGSTVELVGTEKVDGKDAYNLKVTYKSGKTSNYFIDKATNRLVKTSGKASVQGQEMDVETSFSDFKQTTDGYWFPYSITTMQGTLTMDKIETNVPVDEKIYSN